MGGIKVGACDFLVTDGISNGGGWVDKWWGQTC